MAKRNKGVQDMEQEEPVNPILVLPHETVEDAINKLGNARKRDPDSRYCVVYNGIELNSWDFTDGHQALEHYHSEIAAKKIQGSHKQEEMDTAKRVLNADDSEIAAFMEIRSNLFDPNGAYITAKRAYEKGEKPKVEMDGKTVVLDSKDAAARYQKHMFKDYDKAVEKIGGGMHAVAYRDRSERAWDLLEGIMPARIAAEQVKIMQDKIWKTDKTTHQLFRDPAFLNFVEAGKFTLLADEMLKIAAGEENVFDKKIVGQIRNKAEVSDIGKMFYEFGDPDGEMRGKGMASAQNVIARVFRMAFVDQANEALKVTSGMLDQQYTHALNNRDSLVTSLIGSRDTNSQAIIRNVDISTLRTLHDGAQIDAMQRKMQANLDAMHHLDPHQRQSLQDKIDGLFSSTVEALRIDYEKTGMTQRIRHLEELDKPARDAIADEKRLKEEKGK